MIRNSDIDKIICSVCGSKAIFPFGIFLDCLEWASSILASSTPSTPPVFAGGVEGVFLVEKNFDRCSNTGRTYRTRYISKKNTPGRMLHVCNIAQNFITGKTAFDVAFGRVFGVKKP
jgi:hypothetical protein